MGVTLTTPSGTEAGTSLLRGSVRGGLTIVLARGGADAIRLGSMLVLARLLTPAEFGIVAMVTVVVGIADVIQDLGLSSAAVQRPELTGQQSSTLFWLNVTLGVTGTAIVFASAGTVADLLADERVAGAARLLAPMFLLSAMGTQHIALLRRELRFSTIARIRVTGAIVYSITAIALAAAGSGQNALVWGLLLSTAASSALAFAASSFMPGRPKLDRSTREMIAFGVHLAGFGLLNYLAVNLQAVVIGRVEGAAATGLYGRAQRLVSASTGYLLGPVASVAYPVMARLHDQPARWERYYLQAQTIVVIATAGIAPLLIVHADAIVAVLLGPQWEATAPVLAILAVAVAAQGLCSPTGWIFQSRGDSRRMLRWGAFGWTVVLVGTLAGVPFGIEGVATGYAAASVALVWPCLWYAFRGTGLTVRSVLGPLVPILGSAGVAAITSAVSASMIAGIRPGPRVLLATAVHGVVYVLLLVTAGRQRELLKTVLRQLTRPGTVA
jgi:PST family polysaccharide transporter